MQGPAEGFNGEGFAYFPGMGAEGGSEMITTKAIPGCKPGPHTVRFRYLTSQANGVKLDVQSSDTTQPAKVVQFTEPEAGPYTSPLSQLNLSSCVPATTQLIPLIHSEMLKLSWKGD